MTEWQQAFWYARSEFGVPVWTQSSLKSKTFYFISKEMFEKITGKWDRVKDGAKFAAYVGLLFSEMDRG